MEGKRIYVIDDDAAVRRSLFYLLSSAGFDPRVFGSGPDFIADLESLAPGIVLLDLQMPDIDGLELVSRLPAVSRPCFPVVMLTGHGDMATAVRALRVGVRDFLEKPYVEEDLLAILGRLTAELSGLIDHQQDDAEANQRLGTLSAREADVLEHMLLGRLNKEIAYELKLSTRTIEMHRAALFRRLGVRTLADALRMAVGAGWTRS